MRKRLSIMIGLFLISLSWANPLDTLKPLLLDLTDWQAMPASGFNSYQNNIKMINVSRRYTLGEKSLNAVIFITNQASETGWLDSNLQFESAGSSIKTENIDGFQIFRANRKSKKEIIIIVIIHREDNEGTFLALNFKNVDSEEALELAKQFDWNHIEFIVSSME